MKINKKVSKLVILAIAMVHIFMCTATTVNAATISNVNVAGIVEPVIR